jgi:hypothetical protein
MSMVIAVREDSEGGAFIGFEVDHQLLECSECADDAAYRLRYTADQAGNLAKHRFRAHQLISDEHPQHTDRIRIA